MNLDPVGARLVGCLIEKQLTTPQQYPLTLNALTLAANQTSNRDPIMHLEEGAVDAGLQSLKASGLVRFVLPSHGRSVTRFRHVLDEKLALDARQLALLGVLLLRGPQTVAELRARTERMADFAGIDAVAGDLDGLAARPEPLVARLSRRPGHKEERWAQLLSGRPDDDAGTEGAMTAPAPDGLAELRADLADLRTSVDSLQRELGRLRAALGDGDGEGAVADGD
jgi:uncharacterized protein YceH (UPF0502 family)